MGRGTQSKRWVFTLNNYTPDEEAQLTIDDVSFSYMLFGHEVSPSGTPHLQGYFELPKLRSLSTLKKIPGLQRAWMKIAAGTAKQNHVYCGKDGAPFELGKAMEQGKRNDLVEVKRKIDEGATDLELWDHHFSTMVHNHRALKVYKRLVSKPRDFICNVILFVGPTNTHKSHVASLLMKSGHFGSCYTAPGPKPSGFYFDGYDGQDCVLIDEMDGDRCKPTFLNGLCDRYSFSVPVHGSGNVNFRASTIILCSNYVPKDWWKVTNAAPFMRRISLAWFTGKPKRTEPIMDPVLDLWEQSNRNCHTRDIDS